MGPRLFRRGNNDLAGISSFSVTLQWGHAFSGVETIEQNAYGDRSHELQWGHAFSGVETNYV